MASFQPKTVIMVLNDDGTYSITYKDVVFPINNTDEMITGDYVIPRIKAEWKRNCIRLEQVGCNLPTKGETIRGRRMTDRESAVLCEDQSIDNVLTNVEKVISPLFKNGDSIEPIPIRTSDSSSKKNCMDCPAHEIKADPDRDDRFCYDDKKVLCRINHREITYACRPHHLREECETPSWCPMIPKEEDEDVEIDSKDYK